MQLPTIVLSLRLFAQIWYYRYNISKEKEAPRRVDCRRGSLLFSCSSEERLQLRKDKPDETFPLKTVSHQVVIRPFTSFAENGESGFQGDAGDAESGEAKWNGKKNKRSDFCQGKLMPCPKFKMPRKMNFIRETGYRGIVSPVSVLPQTLRQWSRYQNEEVTITWFIRLWKAGRFYPTIQQPIRQHHHIPLSHPSSPSSSVKSRVEQDTFMSCSHKMRSKVVGNLLPEVVELFLQRYRGCEMNAHQSGQSWDQRTPSVMIDDYACRTSRSNFGRWVKFGSSRVEVYAILKSRVSSECSQDRKLEKKAWLSWYLD